MPKVVGYDLKAVDNYNEDHYFDFVLGRSEDLRERFCGICGLMFKHVGFCLKLEKTGDCVCEACEESWGGNWHSLCVHLQADLLKDLNSN